MEFHGNSLSNLTPKLAGHLPSYDFQPLAISFASYHSDFVSFKFMFLVGLVHLFVHHLLLAAYTTEHTHTHKPGPCTILYLYWKSARRLLALFSLHSLSLQQPAARSSCS